MYSEITEITETKEERSPRHDHICPTVRHETPWRGDETLAPQTNHSFRGWILYDGACRSCAASARRFDRIFRRRGFLFLPLQTNWIMKRLDLEPGAPVEEMRLLTADGRGIAAHRDCDHITCNLPPRRRCPGWIALIVLPLLALLARDHVAQWQFMWLMTGAIFLGCKWLTFWSARRQIAHVRVGRALAYFFLWPGMDAEKFLCSPTRKNLTALSR